MKHKVEYFTGTFIDYEGLERKFVMAAVSFKESYIKGLSIGVSVCRPCDVYDEELGKQIAYGKALKNRQHSIWTMDSGLINHETAVTILNTAAKHFVENPGMYLAGYDADAAKYTKTKRINEYIHSLDDETRMALERIASMDDEDLEEFTEAANYIRL